MALKGPSIRIIAAVIIAAIVLGLLLWTLSSPPILKVQSQADLNSSIFSAGIRFTTENFSDGSGSYTFKFGFDFPQNVTQGAHTRLAVYCALIREDITSSFTQGVSLGLQDATLSVDNQLDGAVTINSKMSSSLDIFYLENPNTNLAVGFHNISARLVLYTIDVNYVGNSQGTLNIVILTGNLTILS